MFIFKDTLKRANPYAPYTDANGTRFTRIPANLLEEVPDPQPPVDYTEGTYCRTEQDDAPYVIYTRKSDEQIADMGKAKAAAELKALEQEELTETLQTLREFLMEQPGAAQKPWFERVKAVADKVAEIKGRM